MITIYIIKQENNQQGTAFHILHFNIALEFCQSRTDTQGELVKTLTYLVDMGSPNVTDTF